MYTPLALAVAALTACAIALPPVVREPGNDPIHHELLRNGPKPLEPPNRKSIRDYLLPRYLRSQYVTTEERARIPYPHPQMPASDWLNKEIDRINRMQEKVPIHVPYKSELPPWMNHEAHKRIMFGSHEPHSHIRPYYDLLTAKALIAGSTVPRKHAKILHPLMETTTNDFKVETEPQEQRKVFALTPLDAGYFEPTEKSNSSNKPTADTMEGPHEGGGHEISDEMSPRRQIRQNPITRTKTLVADDLEKLRAGVDLDADDLKDKPRHVRVLGSDFATGTVYAVGIALGVGTVFILGILGFVFGCITLSKRAKAAADVDYPAYGVTGPTMDTSGDRKLAHSAQMYHYQHQKQQIIAMERNCEEQRNGSVSDPESEEENEEGDYTVYECPGFATTGEMEVKNPLFNEDPTPATPGKVEVVKPQPKE